MTKIQCMRRYLIRACYWYYVKADPIMPDRVFDALLKDLERREKAKPDLDPKSPTQMIYGDLESQYPEWAKERLEEMECCDE
jgi:NAD-dependent DNA ligase